MNNQLMAKTNSGKKLTPLKSIKSYCKHHCCCDDRESWVNCSLTSCFLFRYRLGRLSNDSPKKHRASPYHFSKNPIPTTSQAFLKPVITTGSIQTKLVGGEE